MNRAAFLLALLVLVACTSIAPNADLPGMPAVVIDRDAPNAPDGTWRVTFACEDGRLRVLQTSPAMWYALYPGRRVRIVEKGRGRWWVQWGDESTPGKSRES